MKIEEACKILNDATEKYDSLDFIAEPYTGQTHTVGCNNIIDTAGEALQICRALECLLTYIYQNPPKTK